MPLNPLLSAASLVHSIGEQKTLEGAILIRLYSLGISMIKIGKRRVSMSPLMYYLNVEPYFKSPGSKLLDTQASFDAQI